MRHSVFGNDGLYLGCQLVHCEWFGEHVHAWFQVPIADSGVVRITGYEKDLQAGSGLPSRICHLATVDASWQADVGNQKIDANV